MSTRRVHRAVLTATMVIAAGLGVAACERTSTPGAAEPGATGPARAVTQLAHDLRRNDLVAYAQHALPPKLHARMLSAWDDGRTTWPLTELPLDDRLPRFITVLSAPNANKALWGSFQRQFAGAQRQLHSAATTVGLFATQYVRTAPDYSDAERDHYAQVIAALSHWGRQAPLADPELGKTAIAQLVAAARLTGLATPQSEAEAGAGSGIRANTPERLGMTRTLRRLGPFMQRFKQVLRSYGLDLDAALDSVEARVIKQDGDRARVRLRYTLAGEPIEAVMPVERHGQRWYLSALLRDAEATLAGAAAGATKTP